MCSLVATSLERPSRRYTRRHVCQQPLLGVGVQARRRATAELGLRLLVTTVRASGITATGLRNYCESRRRKASTATVQREWADDGLGLYRLATSTEVRHPCLMPTYTNVINQEASTYQLISVQSFQDWLLEREDGSTRSLSSLYCYGGVERWITRRFTVAMIANSLPLRFAPQDKLFLCQRSFLGSLAIMAVFIQDAYQVYNRTGPSHLRYR